MKKDKVDQITMSKKISMLAKLYWMRLLAIITVICGFVGSYFYYGYQFEENANGLRLLLITIFSTFKLYMASPTVSMTTETNIFYEIAMILAPIYTASAVVQIMKKVSLNIFNKIKHIRHNKVFVFGLNDSSKAFIENVIFTEQSKKIIFINDYNSVMKITDLDRLHLLMKGVVIRDGSYTHIPSKYEQKILFNKLRIRNEDVFVLMNEDDSRNLMFLLELKEYLNINKKFKDLKCRIMCSEFGMRNLITDLAKECHELIDINTFDIAEIAINEMFQNPEHLLYDSDRNGENFDIHVIILGFGRIGEEVLKQAVNNGVTSPDNHITFDVFDKDMSDRKEIFLRRFSPEEISVEENTDNGVSTISIGHIDQGRSRLIIRFHICDIRTRRFEKELNEICSRVTYAAICFEDAELSLMSMMVVRRYLNRNVPLAMRMDMDSKIIQYIKDNSIGYGNVFAFCIRNEIFSYERIVGEVLDEQARKANRKYEKYYSDINGGDQQEDNWMKLSIFLKNSNRMQVAHSVTKKELLSNDYYKSVSDIKVYELMSDLRIVVNNKSKLLQYMNDNKKLFEFAQIEHRRWSYFHLMHGYKHVTREQQAKLVEAYSQNSNMNFTNHNLKSECREAYNIHNLIIPWEQLINDEAEGELFSVIYDLIPTIMEL